jgi:hypothetical protein
VTGRNASTLAKREKGRSRACLETGRRRADEEGRPARRNCWAMAQVAALPAPCRPGQGTGVVGSGHYKLGDADVVCSLALRLWRGDGDDDAAGGTRAYPQRHPRTRHGTAPSSDAIASTWCLTRFAVWPTPTSTGGSTTVSARCRPCSNHSGLGCDASTWYGVL